MCIASRESGSSVSAENFSLEQSRALGSRKYDGVTLSRAPPLGCNLDESMHGMYPSSKKEMESVKECRKSQISTCVTHLLAITNLLCRNVGALYTAFLLSSSGNFSHNK